MTSLRSGKHRSPWLGVFRPVAIIVLVSGWAGYVSPARGQPVLVYPLKDGTLVDGGSYGLFDGTADAADWYFNQSSYEGSITLVTQELGGLEHRLVWEYDLSAVSLTPPVSATLTFSIRGAPVWPFPDMTVDIYSYPADLVENLSDFSSGPAVLEGSVNVVSFQPSTEYTVDISTLANVALGTGLDKIGLRFQIDPNTPYSSNQVFIDALDSDPTTKPFVTLDSPALPGDINDDGVLDMLDRDALIAVLLGNPQDPSHVGRADLNSDGTADGLDVQPFSDLILAP